MTEKTTFSTFLNPAWVMAKSAHWSTCGGSKPLLNNSNAGQQHSNGNGEVGGLSLLLQKRTVPVTTATKGGRT